MWLTFSTAWSECSVTHKVSLKNKTQATTGVAKK